MFAKNEMLSGDNTFLHKIDARLKTLLYLQPNTCSPPLFFRFFIWNIKQNVQTKMVSKQKFTFSQEECTVQFWIVPSWLAE